MTLIEGLRLIEADERVDFHARQHAGGAADEIERLRSALEELRVLGVQGSPPDYSRWLSFHDRVAEIATNALNGQGSKSDG